MNEKWITITGYPNYQVSNTGLIKNKATNHLLKEWANSRGYKYVSLSHKAHKRNFAVHRLVATYFVKGKSCDKEVNHKDEDKLNNQANNLEWISHKDNLNYGHHNQKMRLSKINKNCKPVVQKDLHGNVIKYWASAAECGRHGFNSRHVSECCLGKRKTHKHFQWVYGGNKDVSITSR